MKNPFRWKEEQWFQERMTCGSCGSSSLSSTSECSRSNTRVIFLSRNESTRFPLWTTARVPVTPLCVCVFSFFLERTFISYTKMSNIPPVWLQQLGKPAVTDGLWLILLISLRNFGAPFNAQQSLRVVVLLFLEMSLWSLLDFSICGWLLIMAFPFSCSQPPPEACLLSIRVCRRTEGSRCLACYQFSNAFLFHFNLHTLLCWTSPWRM